MPFKAIIKAQERRRLHKCIRNGLEVRFIDHSKFDYIYEFIQKNRQSQKYNLSISMEQLSKQLTQFPDRYLLLAVYDGGNIIAATVSVLVTDKVLYNFLISDDLAYRTYSPTVMLYDALYKFCQVHHFKSLDLGVSLDNNENYKPSLARFKLNMGAETSEKITWIKEI